VTVAVEQHNIQSYYSYFDMWISLHNSSISFDGSCPIMLSLHEDQARLVPAGVESPLRVLAAGATALAGDVEGR
jgi:hypothetical protein